MHVQLEKIGWGLAEIIIMATKKFRVIQPRTTLGKKLMVYLFAIFFLTIREKTQKLHPNVCIIM